MQTCRVAFCWRKLNKKMGKVIKPKPPKVPRNSKQQRVRRTVTINSLHLGSCNQYCYNCEGCRAGRRVVGVPALVLPILVLVLASDSCSGVLVVAVTVGKS